MLLELIWGIHTHVACHRLRHTLASVRHATPTLFAQHGPRLGADSPPAVREMPDSPAALQRGGRGRKEGRKEKL